MFNTQLPDLELHWLDEDDNDSGKTEAALESRVKLGAVTLNEMRDHLGLDPYANAAADRPMVLTPTGYVPIEANAGGEGAGAGGSSGARQNTDSLRETEGVVGKSLDTQGGDIALLKASPDDPEHPGWPAAHLEEKAASFGPRMAMRGQHPAIHLSRVPATAVWYSLRIR